MAAPRKDPARLRIVSWNIHGSVGADRRCDPDRILRHIAALAPDILALQEVDGRTHFGRRPHAFEEFAGALGEHVVEARLAGRPGRDYGHLLWSRWPVRESTLHLLPDGRVEQRGLIEAIIATPHGGVRVLSTHLGLWPGARERQAGVLAQRAAAGDVPTIALGDFNEWRSAGPVHKALSAVLPVCAQPATWPARRPLIRMDRFYATDDIALLSVDVASAAAGASDHLPLVVDLAMPPQRGTG